MIRSDTLRGAQTPLNTNMQHFSSVWLLTFVKWNEDLADLETQGVWAGGAIRQRRRFYCRGIMQIWCHESKEVLLP